MSKDNKGTELACETIPQAGKGAVVCFITVTNSENELKGLLSPGCVITVEKRTKTHKRGKVIESVM